MFKIFMTEQFKCSQRTHSRIVLSVRVSIQTMQKIFITFRTWILFNPSLSKQKVNFISKRTDGQFLIANRQDSLWLVPATFLFG